ncbi:FMN-binding negative transcriptional regulator [Octadecabacter sp.]|nr:FMN-binding negative transcriptional regulator [Octadecabacter sp.]MDC1229426.1 FMN-binding negative transcriptional regulator [Octadecabacter sp.]MDC1231219.1 FMN-binding negative transcriptional regulator [Octadecabacter sp.]MDC1297292.1 FMN-binding negative transcriptional regulator [Octadecabacter sp.]MDC1396838.1 FMN-binding negative transcriptional regulator [Octadecabacter sp.]
MHPNPIYRRTTDARAFDLVLDRAFGQITLTGPDGLLASHIPVLLAPDETTLDMHLVRSNPILRLLDTPQDALLAVMGPDGYVSPDWYGADDQVPTWNYAAVQIRGTLEALDHATMHDMLDRQSAHFEDQLPKTPWTTAKMTPDVLEKMMRQIVPCRMTITDVQSIFKLNQNKPDDVRLRAADAMESSGIGMETATLAALMRNPPE